MKLNKWSYVKSLIKANPSYAKDRILLWNGDHHDDNSPMMLPLHVACLERAPEDLILELIDAYPEALWSKMNSNQHNALYVLNTMLGHTSTSLAFVKNVVERYPSIVKLRDRNSLFPIQRAAIFGLSEAIIYRLYLAGSSFIKDNDTDDYWNLKIDDSGSMSDIDRQFIEYEIGGKIHLAVGSQVIKEKNFDLAISHLQKSLAMRTKVCKKDDPTLLCTYMQLSIAYRNMKRIRSADLFINKAVTIIRSGDRNQITRADVGHAFFEMGIVQQKLHNSKKALKYLTRAGIAYRDAGYDINDPIVQNLKQAITKVFKSYVKTDDSANDIYEPKYENETKRSKSAPASLTRSKQSELVHHIINRNWVSVLNRVETHPKEATSYLTVFSRNNQILTRKLPLHLACQYEAPREIIIAIVDAYPEGVECLDEKGRLPLHSMCAQAHRQNNTAEVLGTLEYLLEKYPQSIGISDAKGQLAIHW